jgi:hypothetical protein
MKKKFLSYLVVFAMVISLVPAMPVTAGADDDDDPIFTVDGVGDFDSLEEALAAAVPSAHRITIRGNVPVTVPEIKVNVDREILLDVGSGLTVTGDIIFGGSLSIMGESLTVGGDIISGGRLWIHTRSLFVEGNITAADRVEFTHINAIVNGNLNAGGGGGAGQPSTKLTVKGDIIMPNINLTFAASHGAEIIVEGNVDGGIHASSTWSEDTSFTVLGNVSGRVIGADRSTVTVEGNAGSGASALSEFPAGSATVVINGNVADWGVTAQGSGAHVTVNGNVTGGNNGVNATMGGIAVITGNVTANQTGVSSFEGGTVTITGNITSGVRGFSIGEDFKGTIIGTITVPAGSPYIRGWVEESPDRFQEVILAKNDGTLVTSGEMEGYLEFKIGTSVVYLDCQCLICTPHESDCDCSICEYYRGCSDGKCGNCVICSASCGDCGLAECEACNPPYRCTDKCTCADCVCDCVNKTCHDCGECTCADCVCDCVNKTCHDCGTCDDCDPFEPLTGIISNISATAKIHSEYDPEMLSLTVDAIKMSGDKVVTSDVNVLFGAILKHLLE